MPSSLHHSLETHFSYIPYNTDIAFTSHYEFIAWFFDDRAEHNLHALPLYLLLTQYLQISSLMLHEINNIDISFTPEHLKINFSLDSTSLSLNITLSKKYLSTSYENRCIYLNWKSFSQLLLYVYTITPGYQAKKMLRIFINESALIPESIYHESHKAHKGKKKFLKNEPLLQWFKKKYPQLDNCEDYALQVMQNSGELMSYETLSTLHLNNPDLVYGTVFNKHSFDTYGYKLAVAKREQAEVLSIGSSRAHFFKEHFFTHSFYNASYTMTYLQEGRKFLETLFQVSKPSLILFSVEFWWFHPHHYTETPFLPLHTEHTHFDSDYINKFYEYYQDELITDDIIKTQNLKNSCGLRANKSYEGYFGDGYYCYAQDLINQKAMKKKTNEACYEMIDKNSFHFKKATTLHKEKFSLFKEILSYCQEQGVKVILTLPPFMEKSYLRLINSPDYIYIHHVIQALSELDNCEFYNFLNPQSVQSPDPEFYDCYHGGDITYARILQTILQNRESILHQYCSKRHLNAIIQDNSNKVIEKTLLEKIKGHK